MRKIFGKIRSFFKCFGVKTPEIKDNTFIFELPKATGEISDNVKSDVVSGDVKKEAVVNE